MGRRHQKNPTARCHFTPIRMTIIKNNKQQITSVGTDVEELERLCVCGGNVKCAAALEEMPHKN